MRSRLKKMLTYLLLTAIILPGWVMGTSLFEKPQTAKAALSGDQILDDSAGSPDFEMQNSANWTDETTGYNHSSKTTSGAHIGEEAEWNYYSKDGGHSLILVSWVVSSSRATNVEYELLEGGVLPVEDISGNKKFNINQTVDSLGETVADGTWSGYKLVSLFDLDKNKDYSLRIDGENVNGSVNADSVLISFNNVAPYDASVKINNGAVYTNSRDVVLNLSAKDDQDVAYVAMSETTPIPDSAAHEAYANDVNFHIASANDGTKKIYVQYADLYFNTSPEVDASIILDTEIDTPLNATASISSNVINVKWDAVAGDLSGIAGYNVYSSSDGFTTKINSSLVASTSYDDTIKTNGSYSYEVEAVDNAGNISAKSAATTPAIVANVVPGAPTNVKTEVKDHALMISWDAVSGVAGYIVTINGVSRDVDNTTSYSTKLDYGTYKVVVTGYYSVDNFGINDSVGLANAIAAAKAAGLEKTVTLSPITKTSTVSEPTIAPEAAEAAPSAVTTEPTDQGLQTEQQGQVKGEEESTQTTEEKINWTPWIILFVLILLAGAATGGYFYWFSGEEEVQTAVKTAKTETPKKTASSGAKPKASSKKPRRW